MVGEGERMVYENFYKNITDFIFVEDDLEKADVIFVPGNRYPDMAEQAAKLWKQGFGKWILPSGRYTIVKGKFEGPIKKADVYQGDYETEWEFLKDVLCKNGVAKEAILKEDQATFTYDNAIYARAVLKEAQIEPEKAIICCNSIHARRCKMYFELVFPNTKFMICPVNATGVTRENWHRSQEHITAVLAEMDRCGNQFEQIIREMQRN